MKRIIILAVLIPMINFSMESKFIVKYPQEDSAIPLGNGIAPLADLHSDLKRLILEKIPETASSIEEAIFTIRSYFALNRRFHKLLEAPTTDSQREEVLRNITISLANRWLRRKSL